MIQNPGGKDLEIGKEEENENHKNYSSNNSRY